MPSYSVRSVIRWAPRPEQEKKFIYEERITAWNAESLDAAIEFAETEAKAYAADKGFEALDLFQGYWLFDEVGLIPQGSEVFSLLRESDLDGESYLDSFFDTGHEKQADYIPTTNEAKSEAEQAGA
jgi:hypothetical protein